MYTDNKNKKKDNREEQQTNFIEGDNVVPQGGNVDDEEPVEERSDNIHKQTNKKHPDINPPLNPPQKTEKKIPTLRKDS